MPAIIIFGKSLENFSLIRRSVWSDPPIKKTLRFTELFNFSENFIKKSGPVIRLWIGKPSNFEARIIPDPSGINQSASCKDFLNIPSLIDST